MKTSARTLLATLMLAVYASKGTAQGPATEPQPDSADPSPAEPAQGPSIDTAPLNRLGEMTLDDLLTVRVVVATRHEQDTRDAPSVTSVLTDGHFALFGMRTLEDALSYFPALQMRRIPNSEIVPVVRGIGTENGVLVLIDGVPVLDTVTGQFYHYNLSLSGVKRIEFLRGPGAALYGPNANAGVIHIVTKDAEDEGTSLGAQVGRPTLVAPHSSFATDLKRLGRVRLSLAAEYDRGKDYEIEDDGAPRDRSLVNPNNPGYVGKRGEPTTRATAWLRWSLPHKINFNSSILFRSLSPMMAPSYGGGRGAVQVVSPSDYTREDLLAANDLSIATQPFKSAKLIVSARQVLNYRSQDGVLTAPDSLPAVEGAMDRALFEDAAYAQHRLSLDSELDAQLPLGNALTAGATVGIDLIDRRHYRTNYSFYNGPTSSRLLFSDQVTEAKDIGLLPDSRRMWAAAYLQDVFSATSWLDVVGGARMDLFHDRGIVSGEQIARGLLCDVSILGCTEDQQFQDLRDGRTYYEISPRLALVGKLDHGEFAHRLKLMAGQAFTPPPILSLTSQTQVNASDRAFGNPLLDPTIGRTLESSYNVGFRTHDLTLGWFYIRTHDEVVYDPAAQQFANSASRSVRGLDVETTGSERLGGSAYELYYRANVTYQKTRSIGGRLLGIGADIYPRVLSNLLLGAQWRRRVSAAVGAKWASESRREPFDPRPNEDPQFIADLTFGLHDVIAEDVSLTFAAKNLTNTYYADPLSQYIGVQGDYPRGGRTFSVDLTLNR